MNDGRSITPELVRKTIAEELEKLRGVARFESARFELAARLFEQITTGAEFPEFMTLVAYEHID
jgi:malate synthase